VYSSIAALRLQVFVESPDVPEYLKNPTISSATNPVPGGTFIIMPFVIA
jgi:hypothetical protein